MKLFPIFALSRMYNLALLGEDKDSFVNHGHTRTGLANARPDWEWRKRKRRESALVCGSKQGYDWPESNSNLEALGIRHILGGVQWED